MSTQTKVKAIMYGAGSIGRGFLGQLFSLSGYEVVFLDINAAVIDALNADGAYPLRLVSPQGWQEQTVSPVRGVNSMDAEAAAREIADAHVMATAVGANILPRIAPVIARGLELRWQAGDTRPLDILICENLLHADRLLRDLLRTHLDPSLHGLLEQRVGLVEASIGRMVPVPTADMQGDNPLRVWAEPYAELPVDAQGFKGPVPPIVGIKPFAPFAFYIERKLFLHNMSHAMLAYLGSLKGYHTIVQAVEDPELAAVVRGALAESGAALAARHGVDALELRGFADDLMVRLDNPLLGDTVARVGRDPLRKLAPDDRLAGSARLCVEQSIAPRHICRGIAAALCFAEPTDPAAAQVQQRIAMLGAGRALWELTGLDPEQPAFAPILEEYERMRSENWTL